MSPPTASNMADKRSSTSARSASIVVQVRADLGRRLLGLEGDPLQRHGGRAVLGEELGGHLEHVLTPRLGELRVPGPVHVPDLARCPHPWPLPVSPGAAPIIAHRSRPGARDLTQDQGRGVSLVR